MSQRHLGSPSTSSPPHGWWARWSGADDPWSLTRALYLRSLGLVVVLAVFSYGWQLIALNGAHGIAPATDYVDAVETTAAAQGWTLFKDLSACPSLFRLWRSDTCLYLLAGLALFGGVLLTSGRLAGPGLVCVLLGWGSIVSVGGVFTGYQWDIFTLEVCVSSLFIAPWKRRFGPGDGFVNLPGRWLLRIVLFKFMWLQGLVKWRSGDAAWEHFTALDYHFWTQPIPHGVSWWAHQLPDAVDHVLVGGMFVVELVLPWFIFGGRCLRAIAAAGTTLLMAGVAATGNYGTFNVLTAVLCIPLLDDGVCAAAALRLGLLPGGSARHQAAPSSRLSWLSVPLVALLTLLHLVVIHERAGFSGSAPSPLKGLAETARRWHLCSSYGAFSHMTKERPEIAIEASMDGKTWRPYVFRYKTLSLDRSHGFAATHMPRLDWQLWFAALRGDCRRVRWYPLFLKRLLEAEPRVLDLFASAPMGTARPRFIRSTLFRYSFSSADERRAHGRVWSREPSGSFCPTVTLSEGRVVVARP